MTTTYIYRVETTNQEGPYINELKQGDILREALTYTQMSSTHPGMWLDCSFRNLVRPSCKYFCGFNTIEQLHAWFTDQALKVCAAFNLHVSIYSCDELYISFGTFQVAFVLDQAERIDVLSIADVIRLRP